MRVVISVLFLLLTQCDFMWAQMFTESDLPIIIIDTEGARIRKEPKVLVKMKVINNKDGVNKINDTKFEYDGYAGIEFRGNSSYFFYEKKSYTLETQLEDGSNNNVSLLGLPEENDWVLYAPFADKTMARNVLAYTLGNSQGRWAPHTRYVELYLDNEYRGVYVLTEKIKIDKNRVDLATLTEDDNIGDQVTGGYLMRIDRQRPGAWVSPFLGWTGTSDEPISYLDPGYDELTESQQYYIRDHVTDFEYNLASDNFKDPENGYRAYIDVTSFIDHFIMTELCRDLDGYRCSVYFYKDKNSKGGKITMGPPWDFNLCYGNGNFMEAFNPEGWAADGIGSGDGYEPIFWWNRLLQDSYFKNKLTERWDELRADEFSLDNIFSIIDSCATVLENAKDRNYQKFKILGRRVWPNEFVGDTYGDEVNYLKDWINLRINWLDDNIPYIQAKDYDIVEAYPRNDGYEPESVNAFSQFDYIKLGPNPFHNIVKFEMGLSANADVNISITNVLGQVVVNRVFYNITGQHKLELSADHFNTSKGNVYFYSITIDDKVVKTGKLIQH